MSEIDEQAPLLPGSVQAESASAIQADPVVEAAWSLLTSEPMTSDAKVALRDQMGFIAWVIFPSKTGQRLLATFGDNQRGGKFAVSQTGPNSFCLRGVIERFDDSPEDDHLDGHMVQINIHQGGLTTKGKTMYKAKASFPVYISKAGPLKFRYFVFI
eukprot:m.256105 g.256105  ORF g.256105 m.256105 type:complete len:157 (+) comp15512_c3_seq1:430-900(+)